MTQIHASVGRGGVNLPNDVIAVQMLLNTHAEMVPDMEEIFVCGLCTAETVRAIEIFQQRVVRLTRADGRVDPRGRTLRKLNETPRERPRYNYPVGPQEPLADIARPYIGAREARGNRMGTDPRMREIFEADRLWKDGDTDGYPWCAAFVSLCVQKLIDQSGLYNNVTPPRTAGVRKFYRIWAPAQDCLVFAPDDRVRSPHRGDVVVYQHSHIGIVNTVGTREITAIEGNTNAQGSREGTTVREQNRAFDAIRCFIRLPIPMTYDVANQICRPQPSS